MTCILVICIQTREYHGKPEWFINASANPLLPWKGRLARNWASLRHMDT